VPGSYGHGVDLEIDLAGYCEGDPMTEVIVKFTDYLIPFSEIQTGTVSYARVASWLTRYPLARITEKLGKMTTIVIDTGVPCPPELRADE
jgi:hypothetical protein